jgi:hypothetical protein
MAWNAVLLNAHWGMQRLIGNKWVFNTILGAGYAVNGDDF